MKAPKLDRLSYFIIVGAVALVYSNTLINGYNLDDEFVTKGNVVTSSESDNSLIDIFTFNYGTEGNLSYGYRPITVATFYIEHRLFKESPAFSHAINIILFGLLCLLVHKVLRIVFFETNLYILLFVSLLFVVHAAHSEVVASIKNRDEILALLFLLLAIWASLKWVKKDKVLLLLLMTSCVALSVLSKKTTLPVIFLIPTLLLIRYDLRLKRFILFCFLSILPLAVFVFNYKVFEGAVLLFLAIAFNFGVYYARIYALGESVTYSKIIKVLVIVTVAGVLLFTGLFIKEIALWAIGLSILVIFFKKQFEKMHLVFLALLVVGYFTFNDMEILMFAVLLVSSLVLMNYSAKAVRWLVPLIIIILVSIAAIAKGNALFLFTYASPLLIFYTSRINRFVPVIISALFIVFALIFGFFNIFLVPIFIYSCIPAFQQQLEQSYVKLVTPFWVLVFSIFLIVSYNTNAPENIVLEKNNYPQAQDLSKNQSGELQVGRKLEFVENTLVVEHTMNQRLATGFAVMGEYLRLMVFPKELLFYYGFAKVRTADFSEARVWFSILLHLGLFILFVLSIRQQPMVAIGLLWYGASIFIFSNLPVLIAGMVGERLSFTASFGFCLFVGGLLNWLKPEFNYGKVRVVEVVSLLILIVLGTRTLTRNAQWESATKLMRNDINHLGNSAQANYLLAVHSLHKAIESPNQLDTMSVGYAIKHFKRAIEIYPSYYNYHIDLGKAYLMVQDFQSAKNCFLLANSIEPNAIFGLFELSKVCFSLKEYRDVIQYSTLYLEADKTNSIIYELLAYSYYFNNQPLQAVQTAKNGLGYFSTNKNLLDLIQNLEHTQER